MLKDVQRQGDKVLELLRETYPEYHPLIGLAKIAHTTEDERLEFDCHKVLSEFVEPKLKSVEVQQTISEDSLLRVVFDGEYEEIPEHDGTTDDGPPALEKLPVDEILDSPVILDEAVNS